MLQGADCLYSSNGSFVAALALALPSRSLQLDLLHLAVSAGPWVGEERCSQQPSASVSPPGRWGSEAGAALRGGGQEDMSCGDCKSPLGGAPVLGLWKAPVEVTVLNLAGLKRTSPNICSFPMPFSLG